MTEELVGQRLPEMKLGVSGHKTEAVELPKDLDKWTILYFYPKDDTPGCTKQACSYRDNLPEFEKLDAQIFGISADDHGSHLQFQEKYSLPFPLISDSEKKLGEYLGVFRERERDGKTFVALSRDTFLIDKEGTIRQVWRNVDPTTTVEETAEAIRSFS